MIYPHKVRIQQIIKRNFLQRKTSKVIKMANLEYLMRAISWLLQEFHIISRTSQLPFIFVFKELPLYSRELV